MSRMGNGEFNRSLHHPLCCEVLYMHSKTERIVKEAQFWVLMAQGSTLIAACNAVGVDRRTGRRWRQATGGLIPRKKPEPSGRYLSLDERLRIADLHLTGASARSIGVQMDRSASTFSRELRRNGAQRSRRGCGAYAPYAAQKKAELRGCRPKGSKFDGVELADLVQAKLCVKWSLVQISDHLTAMFPDRAGMRVCPETIYQALYARGRGYLRADLHQHLRTGRGVRRPRRSAGNRPGKIPDMVLISERPVEVDDRAVPRHWEGTWCWGQTVVQRSPRWWSGKVGTRCWSTCPTITVPSPYGRGW